MKEKMIGHFIVDFYCHKAKLVVEIDGSQHYTTSGQRKDGFRTEVLEGYDLKVIRFSNREINLQFREVCEYIDAVIRATVLEENPQSRCDE